MSSSELLFSWSQDLSIAACVVLVICYIPIVRYFFELQKDTEIVAQTIQTQTTHSNMDISNKFESNNPKPTLNTINNTPPLQGINNKINKEKNIKIMPVLSPKNMLETHVLTEIQSNKPATPTPTPPPPPPPLTPILLSNNKNNSNNNNNNNNNNNTMTTDYYPKVQNLIVTNSAYDTISGHSNNSNHSNHSNSNHSGNSNNSNHSNSPNIMNTQQQVGINKPMMDTLTIENRNSGSFNNYNAENNNTIPSIDDYDSNTLQIIEHREKSPTHPSVLSIFQGTLFFFVAFFFFEFCIL